MHSLYLLRIDYGGFSFQYISVVCAKRRAVFMCTYCFAIRYDVCTVHSILIITKL